MSHSIRPVLSSAFSRYDRRKKVLVYFMDSTDVMSPEAISEATRLKMGGVEIYVVKLDGSMDSVEMRQIRQLASAPTSEHLLVLNEDKQNIAEIQSRLITGIC